MNVTLYFKGFSLDLIVKGEDHDVIINGLKELYPTAVSVTIWDEHDEYYYD